jgi:hypothetical protein
MCLSAYWRLRNRFSIVGAAADFGAHVSELLTKESMSFGRLVASASVFSLLFALTSVMGARTWAVLGRMLMPLGSHSLLAFVLHLLAVVTIATANSVAGAGLSEIPLASAALQALTVGFVWVAIRLGTRLAALPRPQLAGRRQVLAWPITASLLRG